MFNVNPNATPGWSRLENSMLSILAAAGIVYSLEDAAIPGQKPFTQYVEEIMLGIAGKAEGFELPASAAHLVAWHYMFKYDGTTATVQNMLGNIPEYLKSDFTPWAIIEITGEKLIGYEYAKKGSMDAKIQKIESARSILELAPFMGRPQDSAIIRSAMKSIEEARKEIGFLYIDSILGEEELNPLFGSQFKPKAREILMEILNACDIPDNMLQSCTEISSMISLSWFGNREVSLKNILLEMEAMPSYEVGILLSAMAKT
ncbi:MAG TPA: hypothetical protein PLO51_03345, partial [Candidatus Micrarchaeota archaeon]|nr:hypothetical protein [Candidatus Micrarchaeota archaeon]